MDEITQLKQETASYIQVVYNNLQKILDKIYKFEEIDLKAAYGELNNVINIVNYMTTIYNFEGKQIDTTIIMIGLSNFKESLEKQNYYMLCDTLEYEVINPMGAFFEMLH